MSTKTSLQHTGPYWTWGGSLPPGGLVIKELFNYFSDLALSDVLVISLVPRKHVSGIKKLLEVFFPLLEYVLRWSMQYPTCTIHHVSRAPTSFSSVASPNYTTWQKCKRVLKNVFVFNFSLLYFLWWFALKTCVYLKQLTLVIAFLLFVADFFFNLSKGCKHRSLHITK